MAFVRTRRTDKGNEKNDILFPTVHVFHRVGVSNCRSHCREHRPCEIIFRKAESGMSLVDYLAEFVGQYINGKTISVKRFGDNIFFFHWLNRF